MALTGLEWMMLAQMGTGLLGGLLGGGDQEMKSFSGTEFNAPAMMGKASGALDNVFSGAMGRASEPIQLTGPNPGPLPTFSGGGLPMSIGAMGRMDGPVPSRPGFSLRKPRGFSDRTEGDGSGLNIPGKPDFGGGGIPEDGGEEYGGTGPGGIPAIGGEMNQSIEEALNMLKMFGRGSNGQI